MKKTIITSLFQDEGIKEIKNLFFKIIKIKFKKKDIISNLKETWTKSNFVIIEYEDNKNKLKKVYIQITDFEIMIKSKETEDVINVEITIKKHLKKVQKYFV